MTVGIPASRTPRRARVGGQPFHWSLARVSVSDSLDDWTRASVSPLSPRFRVCCDPGTSGSGMSVFYFNEGTWPLGPAFLVSHSRRAKLRQDTRRVSSPVLTKL